MNAKNEKMLAAALKAVSAGATGIIVVQGMLDVRPTALALSAMDYGGVWDARVSKYRTQRGGILYIMPMRNEAADPKKLKVRGYTDETTFWDPAVVREAHARILQEYHRYD